MKSNDFEKNCSSVTIYFKDNKLNIIMTSYSTTKTSESRNGKNKTKLVVYYTSKKY